MRAILATISSTSCLADDFFALDFGRMLLRGARLVDHVNRLVRQVTVVDVNAPTVRPPRSMQPTGWYLTPWCSSKRDLRPFEDGHRLRQSVGSTTSTFWKRRDSAVILLEHAAVFVVKVVAPIHLS
jgi:hypothetical protein